MEFPDLVKNSLFLIWYAPAYPPEQSDQSVHLVHAQELGSAESNEKGSSKTSSASRKRPFLFLSVVKSLIGSNRSVAFGIEIISVVVSMLAGWFRGQSPFVEVKPMFASQHSSTAWS